MIKNDLSVMIGGRAGDGSLATGEILARVFKNLGLDVCTYRDFPSNIRGLPTTLTIRAKYSSIFAVKDYVDILLALGKVAVEQHVDEVCKGGVVIYDDSDEILPQELQKDWVHFYNAPVRRMAIENLGGSSGEIFKNIISVGILSFLLDIDESVVKDAIRYMFLRKGDAIVEKNFRAYALGRNFAAENIRKEDPYLVERIPDKGRILVMGDEAIGYGALVAGCRFYSGYPITPATELMEWLAKHMPKYNGIVLQAEDELAAINMAIGAGYAGARSMTGTSGPGLSLMTEGIGLAGMTEVPIVVVHGQRAGPATGLPTKTEQSDLKHVLFSGHGDFPRIVISPGSVEEAFYMTAAAFNLAEKYQCPVFLLVDQFLCQNRQTIDRFDLGRVKIDRGKLLLKVDEGESARFKRFALTDDGISPRTIPSIEGGIYEASGNEHDEWGNTCEDPKLRIAMMEKRLKKLDTAKKDLIPPAIFGREDSKIGIISYGSPHGAILEALEQLEQKGLYAKYMQLRTLWPFPERDVRNFLNRSDRVYVVENSAMGQLSLLVKMSTGDMEKLVSILKYSGRPFRPIEISGKLEGEM